MFNPGTMLQDESHFVSQSLPERLIFEGREIDACNSFQSQTWGWGDGSGFKRAGV